MSGLKDSDRYFTPPEILSIVLEQWPAGIDLDPCADELAIVVAANNFNIRLGQDGLVLPWEGKVFLNPPYSMPEPWLARAALHGNQGGEVLALVNAAVGTRAWLNYVWPHALVCCLAPRPKFRAYNSDKHTSNTKDSAVVYFGADRERFAEVWKKRGKIVEAVSRKT